MDRMLRNRKAIVFFVAPAFVLFTVVLLIPILQMLYYSLCDYNALKEPVFIGLDNFKTLLFEEHGELPDIITVRRFSGKDAQDLEPYLMDFASYDVVSRYVHSCLYFWPAVHLLQKHWQSWQQ